MDKRLTVEDGVHLVVEGFARRPHEYSPEQRKVFLDKLDLLDDEMRIQFLHDFVHSYEPNWVVTRPDNFVLHGRSQIDDGLPYVRHPIVDGEMENAHYLWNQEFLNEDNFIVFIKMLGTNLSRETFLTKLDEADFNFLIYWSTLIVMYASRYQGVLPAELVHTSALYLGFLHESNKANPGENFPHKTLAYEYKYAQRLAVFAPGSSEVSRIRTLDDPRYIAELAHLESRLPADLEVFGEAGQYYANRSSKREQRLLSSRHEDNYSPETTIALSFADAMRRNAEKGNAYFRTEHREKQSLVKDFQGIMRMIVEISQQPNPELIFFIDSEEKSLLVNEYFLNFSKVNLDGGQVFIYLESLQPIFDQMIKGISVETWQYDKKNIKTFISILRKTLVVQPKVTGINQYAEDVYEGQEVQIDEKERVHILKTLKEFVQKEILEEKKFDKNEKKKTFLGSVRGKEVVRRPNYPFFGGVTAATLLLLVGLLEEQGPQFQWGRDIQDSVGRLVALVQLHGTNFIDSLTSPDGTEVVSDESHNQEATTSRQIDVKTIEYVENFFTYSPENNSLAELKNEEQTPVFTVETPEGQPWAIPSVTMSYHFSEENPFQVEFVQEKLQVVEEYVLDIENISDRPDGESSMVIRVDMSLLQSPGVLIPIDFDTDRDVDIHLYGHHTFRFFWGDSSKIKFVLGENDSTFLFIPGIGSFPHPNSELLIDVRYENIEAEDQEIVNQFNLDYIPVKFNFSQQNTIPVGELTSMNRDLERLKLFGIDQDKYEEEASQVVRDFLVEQGFDLNKMQQKVEEVMLPGGDLPASNETLGEFKERARNVESELYNEILRQMVELGFRYSNDTSVNKFLTPDDVRTYFLVGKHVGLDCDGLSFITNFIANASETVTNKIRPQFILSEADIDNDQAFSGSPNHAQLRILASDKAFPTLEVTSFFETTEQATPEELHALIDEIQEVIYGLNPKAQNFDRLVLFFITTIIGLSSILVARWTKRKAKKTWKNRKEISTKVKEQVHKLEVRTTERLFPAFENLTPAQLAKVTEVLSLITNQDFFDHFKKTENEGLYDQEKITQLLTSFELDEKIAPEKQIEAAQRMSYLSKAIFVARSNNGFRKSLLASLDSVIDTHSSNEGMEDVLVAVQALLI